MGEVYLGEKVGPEGFLKPVVLKCVLPQLAKDRAFVQLFLDEARLAALLNHPNIAQIYDFGTVDNIYFMAMEYVPGYTVDEIRRKHRSIDRYMPVEHIACISSQACQGLNYAHTLTDAHEVGLGLVHRDVSPHNLIVSVDGAVKIVDFGIAKARAGLTRVQAKGAVGKFGYMSPEQSRGEPVDARTDVFSLGICLWELTTNRRLHDPKLDRPPEYHKERPIPPVTVFRRDVPRQFERILETALSVDPMDRYPTCQDMYMEIERFLAAMVHYAGNSALAGYIKGLVDGTVESPPETPTGGMVEPASGSGVGHKRLSEPGRLEAAQRYEEVFGVGAAPGARSLPPSASSLPRAVPQNWEAKKPSSPPQPESEKRPSKTLDVGEIAVHTGRTPQPELERRNKRAEQDRAARASRTKSSTTGRFVATAAGLIVVLGGLGYAGWTFQDSIFAIFKKTEDPPPAAPSESSYRIVSDPAGAVVSIDGKKQQGVTPLVVKMTPGTEYQIAIELPKYGTKRALFKASDGAANRELPFHLTRAGTLKISSDPAGGAIELNGFELPNVTTPATLEDVPSGEKLRVTVSLPGRSAVTKTITIQEGRIGTLGFKLPAQQP
jgi:serine/threonine protein kinase